MVYKITFRILLLLMTISTVLKTYQPDLSTWSKSRPVYLRQDRYFLLYVQKRGMKSTSHAVSLTKGSNPWKSLRPHHSLVTKIKILYHIVLCSAYWFKKLRKNGICVKNVMIILTRKLQICNPLTDGWSLMHRKLVTHCASAAMIGTESHKKVTV